MGGIEVRIADLLILTPSPEYLENSRMTLKQATMHLRESEETARSSANA